MAVPDLRRRGHAVSSSVAETALDRKLKHPKDLRCHYTFRTGAIKRFLHEGVTGHGTGQHQLPCRRMTEFNGLSSQFQVATAPGCQITFEPRAFAADAP